MSLLSVIKCTMWNYMYLSPELVIQVNFGKEDETLLAPKALQMALLGKFTLNYT